MIGAVWRVVRNEEDFDEAFQEATSAIWKRLRRIRRHPNPHALVLRICINAAYDVLRRRVRARKRELLSAARAQGAVEVPSASHAMEQQSRRDQLLAAIARLPANQARSILMRYMEGLSYPEIAAALGCNEATVRTHVSRACHRLRQLLPNPTELG